MKYKLAVFKGDRVGDQSEAEKLVKKVNYYAGRPVATIIQYSEVIFSYSQGNLEVKRASDNRPIIELASSYYLRDYHGYHHERYALARYLPTLKKRIFNSDLKANETLSKLEQMVALGIHNLPLPDSLYVQVKNLHKIENQLTYPVVVKSILSSEGRLNYLVNSKAGLRTAVKKAGGKTLIQQFIDNDGDYRVVVMYGRPAVAYKKTRDPNSQSHLNNVAQGAKRTLIDDKDVIDLAVKTAKVLGREFCGVDILRSKLNQKLFILESNFNAGIAILGDGVDEQYYKNAAQAIMKSG